MFIEDLDRFSDSTIFIKLRELNNILNNYEEIKRKITFVYAVKDDIFIGEERTKFFDFIIPVIPIINSTNSGEILRKKLDVKEVGDGIYRSSIYDISEQYINMISPYIDDMRILINICNEFEIYRKTIGDSQELNLEDEQMFSLIVFKNLYPKEFAELEVEKGIVKTAFEDKQNFINEKAAKLKEKNRNLQLSLENIENDILNELKEVKAAFMNYLTDSSGALYYCNVNNRQIYYIDIMQDTFNMRTFENQRCSIYYYNRNSLTNRSVDATMSEEKQIVNEYIQRCEYIKNNTDERKEAFRAEIKKNETDLYRMRELSIKELIDRYGSDNVLGSKVGENNLLVFLLRNGFLDENYSHYINYFHPNSIDPEEMNFILGIRNYKAVGGYDYSLKHPAQIIERIEDFEFKQIEVLNYSLMDYMLMYMTESKKFSILMKQLSNRTENSKSFIKSYIERNVDIDGFILNLCKYNIYLWHDFMYDSTLTEDSKYNYLCYILLYSDIEDIVKLNIYDKDNKDKIINIFLRDKNDVLQRIKAVPTKRIFDIIEKLQIKFKNINVEGVSNNVLDFIYENQYYEVNRYTLNCLFKTKYPDKVKGLITANYTTILETGYEPLLRYIESDFERYVQEFIIDSEENTEEAVSAVENVLERLWNKNFDLCIKVLEKEPVIWEHLTDCCNNFINEDSENEEIETIWNYVIENSKVKVTWNNFYEYYDRYGLTDVLISFLNDNIDVLIADKDMSNISDDIIKSIIVKNIPLSTFEKIVSNITVDEFTNDLDEFVDEEIDVMIDINYFSFTIERLNEMKEFFPDKCVHFILNNKDAFFNIIDQTTLSVEDITTLVQSKELLEEEKQNLFTLIKPENVDTQLAIAIKDAEYTIEKNI